MLTYVLAWIVGLGSLVIYLAAFFFPEVHRKNDFIWSGVGLFYALVLWVYAERITGGLLLGQTASVALLSWLSWQTLKLRRELTLPEQQTQLPDSGAFRARIGGMTSKLQGALAKLPIPGVAAKLPEQASGFSSKLNERGQETQTPITPKFDGEPAAKTISQPSSPADSASSVVVNPAPEAVTSEVIQEEVLAEALSPTEAIAAKDQVETPPTAAEEEEAVAETIKETQDIEPADLRGGLQPQPKGLPIPVDLPKLQEQITGLASSVKTNLPKLQEQVTGLVQTNLPKLQEQLTGLVSSVKGQGQKALATFTKRETQPKTSAPEPAAAEPHDLWQTEESLPGEEKASLETAIAAEPAAQVGLPSPADSVEPEAIAETLVIEEIVADIQMAPLEAENLEEMVPSRETEGVSPPLNSEIPTSEVSAFPETAEASEKETLPELVPPHPPDPELVAKAQASEETETETINIAEIAPEVELAPSAEASGTENIEVSIEAQPEPADINIEPLEKITPDSVKDSLKEAPPPAQETDSAPDVSADASDNKESQQKPPDPT
jgi:hypothetical protein